MQNMCPMLEKHVVPGDRMPCRVASKLEDERGLGGAWRLKAQVGGGGPALAR